ncbi:MAG: exo-beta-1,3-glucanase (GH17 family) [Cyclobacteriaceae bacterium]|jgi:exo-beta-1,3-glucanase (GH17 family)
MRNIELGVIFIVLLSSCMSSQETKQTMQSEKKVTAQVILGNSDYQAISYGGYRGEARTEQPAVSQLKEDMLIMSAMGIKVLRTYNLQLPHASNVLKAIAELKAERADFEMYVMLGAWIDCKNAWTDQPVNHDIESEFNKAEIDRAVQMANQYPDIVKVLAVGNEAMVKWAATYFVQPDVILKWVNYLQELKKTGKLSIDVWVTSSDNFASWGGGSDEYHVEALNQLIEAVDYISLHTYPMHDTHYHPVFWGIDEREEAMGKEKAIELAMQRSIDYAKQQYDSVKNYIKKLGIEKQIHIGETGWASEDNHLYGIEGAQATDEYKQSLYYHMMREWTDKENISCFFFEAFDEPWKDASNVGGSENHFGLFTVDGQAKHALWSTVDQGTFKGLTRDGKIIGKTFEGNEAKLLESVPFPPVKVN